MEDGWIFLDCYGAVSQTKRPKLLGDADSATSSCFTGVDSWQHVQEKLDLTIIRHHQPSSTIINGDRP